MADDTIPDWAKGTLFDPKKIEKDKAVAATLAKPADSVIPDWAQGTILGTPAAKSRLVNAPDFSNVHDNSAVDGVKQSRGGVADFIRDTAQLGSESYKAQRLQDRIASNVAKEDNIPGLDDESTVSQLLLKGPMGYVVDKLGNGIADLFSTTKKISAAKQLEQDRSALQATQERVSTLQDRLGTEHFYDVGRIAPGVGSLAGQPEQALPIVGAVAGSSFGPAGTVAGGAIGSIPLARKQAASAYAEARGYGASKEDSLKYAGMIAGINFGLNTAASAGEAKVLGFATKVPEDAAKKWLLQRATSTVSKVAKAEVISNAVSQAAQAATYGAQTQFSFDNPEAQKKYKEQLDYTREHYGEQAADNLMQTSLLTAVTAGPLSAMHARQEGRTGRAQTGGIADMYNRVDKAVSNAVPPTSAEDTAKMRNEATAKAEKQRTAQNAEADQRAADQKEADYRNMQAMHTASEYRNADNPMAQKVLSGEFKWTPEMVAEERKRTEAATKQKADADAAAKAQADREALVNKSKSTLDTQRALDQKAADLAEKKARTAAAAQERARRVGLAKQVMKEMPNATPEEQVSRLADLLEQPAPTTEATPEVAPKAAAKKDTAATTDADLRALAKAKGRKVSDVRRPLNMLANDAATEQAAKESTGTVPPEKQGIDYGKRRAAVIDHLFKGHAKGDQESTDALNLVRSGKLILADNAESVGHKDEGQAAHYDPKSGKLRIFMDKINPKTPALGAAIKEMTAHESTHGGQLNDREGRSQPLRVLMGNDGLESGVELITKAAKGGNKIAKDALAHAKKAVPLTAESSHADMQDHAHEILAYFAGEASRGKSVGTLSGLKNKMVGSARDFMREKMGANLPVDIGDLAYASKRAAGEIVKTKLTPSQEAAKNMIYPETAAGFEDAMAKGHVYTSADGRQKFMMSDLEAKIKPDALEKLRTAKGPIPAHEVLTHDTLYKQLPDAKNVKLNVVPDKIMEETYGGDASYNPRDRNIYIKADVLNRAADAPNSLKEVVMHEMQHWAQDDGGYLEGNQYRDSGATLKARREFNALGRRLTSAVRDMLDVVPAKIGKELQGSMKREFTDVLYDRYLTDDEKARYMSAAVDDFNIELDPKERAVLDIYRDARVKYNAGVQPYNDANAKALGDYHANILEREAHFTQWNMDRPESEIRAINNPEQLMRYQAGAEAPSSRGRIDVNNPLEPLSKVALAPRPKNMSTEAKTIPEEAISDKEKIRRIVDHAIRGQTADLKVAETLDVRYRAALRKEGIDPKDTETQEQIDRYLSEKDPDKRRMQQAAFARNHPELEPVLKEMRDLIDQKSNELVDLLLNSGVELTKQQIGQVSAILANEGSYLTRSYSAFQGSEGKKFAKQRIKDYEGQKENIPALRERIKQGDTLSNAEQSAVIVQDAIDHITKAYSIPKDDDLARMSITDLKDMYDSFIGNSDTIHATGDEESRRVLLTDALKQYRDSLSPDSVEGIAYETARQLIGVENTRGPLAAKLTQLARDPGTLTSRTHVGPEIRRFLGEIDNPAGKALTTAATQSALIARHGIFSDLLSKHYGEFVVNTGDRNKMSLADKKRFPYQLNDEKYGALNKHWVSKDAYARVRDLDSVYHTWQQAVEAMQSNANPIVGKTLKALSATSGKLNRFGKYGTVIWNLPGWPLNYVGSYLSLLSNGNINPVRAVTTGAKGHYLAGQYAVSRVTNRISPELQDIHRYVNLEAVDVGDIQRVLGNTLKDYMDGRVGGNEVLKKIQTSMSKYGGKYIDKANRFTVAGYAMMDGWTKIANFYERLKTLQDFHEALGSDLSPEELKRMAGDTTSYTNVSAERVHPILRAGESAGLTTYMPYFAEVMRTTFANFKQSFLDYKLAADAYKQGNTKAGAIMLSSAVKRAVGNSLATVAIPSRMGRAVNNVLGWMGVAGGAFALAGGTDQDDKRRRLLGDMTEMADIVQVGTSKEGNPIYMNISGRADPRGPLTDMFRAISTAPTTEEAVQNAGKALLDLYLAPSYLRRLKDVLVDGDRVFDPAMERISPEHYNDFRNLMFNEAGVDTQDTDRFTYIAETLLPKFVRSQDPRYVPDSFGPKMTPTQIEGIKTLASMGAPIQELDIAKEMKYRGYDASDQYKKIKSTFSDLVKDRKNPTDEDVLTWTAQYRRDYLEQFNKDHQLVESMRAWGLSDDQIMTTLKNSRYSKDIAKRLIDDDRTIHISTESLKKSLKSTDVSEDDATKQENSDELAKAIKRMQSLQGTLKKINVEVE